MLHNGSPLQVLLKLDGDRVTEVSAVDVSCVMHCRSSRLLLLSLFAVRVH